MSRRGSENAPRRLGREEIVPCGGRLSRRPFDQLEADVRTSSQIRAAASAARR